MALNLTDILKKAKDRGIGFINNNQSATQPLRPWQQESTLFLSKKPVTNCEQTNNKPTITKNNKTANKIIKNKLIIEKAATNRQQTDNKERANQQQTDNKQITNRQQNKNKNNITNNKPAAQAATQPGTNREQTDNKAATITSFSSLVGLQLTLIIFIYNECKIARSKSTKNLTLDYISKTIPSSPGCIKTTLQRLEAKKFIERIEYKNGRGGWSKYSISDHHFQEILQHETSNNLETKWQQSNNKATTELATQPTTLLSSSGSINKYIKTTTESIADEVMVSGKWRNLDIEPLSQIGFTVTHLNQIASQNKLTAEIVQDSIYAFAFDLQENNKSKSIKGDPINFFMGILRNGKPYLPPSNYESPQDKAMRLYLENRKEREQKEQEVIDFAFTDWFAQLANEEKVEFLPEELRKSAGAVLDPRLTKAAMQHFKMAIWPSKREEILGKTKAKKVEEVNGE